VLTHRLGLLDAAALPMNDVALSNAGGALSPRELGLLRALAEAALPAGSFLPGVSEETLASTADYVGTFPPRVQKAYRAALWALELETLPRFRGRFSTLPLATRQRALEGWEKSRLYAARTLLRLVLTPPSCTTSRDRRCTHTSAVGRSGHPCATSRRVTSPA
jgi:hypothetical protein